MAARNDLKQFANATYTCRQCGKVVTRADKPKAIYSAFIKRKYCGYECARLASRHDERAYFFDHLEPQESGCIHWTGPRNDKGYGVIHVAGRKQSAHRYSYELQKGPLGGLNALHSCDNPRCVNIKHLRPGTQLENMQDAKARGRFDARKALPHPTAKLTAEQVQFIRQSNEVGASLARAFGLSKSTIYAVRNGQNWSNT